MALNRCVGIWEENQKEIYICRLVDMFKSGINCSILVANCDRCMKHGIWGKVATVEYFK